MKLLKKLLKIIEAYSKTLLLNALTQEFLPQGLQLSILRPNNRSSHQRCSVRKGVLRNFAKFTGTHFARVSFLIKLQASVTNNI